MIKPSCVQRALRMTIFQPFNYGPKFNGRSVCRKMFSENSCLGREFDTWDEGGQCHRRKH